MDASTSGQWTPGYSGTVAGYICSRCNGWVQNSLHDCPAMTAIGTVRIGSVPISEDTLILAELRRIADILDRIERRLG